ncbi:MAG: CoA pyrophosphatase [Flavobacteriales bacterium]|jgi:8-oxo-dGTP pyrophosphatase MutT (NUDIX family)
MTLEALKDKLHVPLPGISGQREMMPSYRNDLSLDDIAPLKPRKAGVIIHIFQGPQELEVLYMKRPAYDGTHSGQISFPGGELEEFDRDLMAAAFRECEEEVNLGPVEQEFFRAISWLYIPPSNFYVEPFITLGTAAPKVELDPREVDRVFSIPLSKLIDGSLIRQTSIKTTYGTLVVPAYHWDGEIIWGATAMMTAELVALLR